MANRIVIVGAGIVGRNLGVRLREVGHHVDYAGRDPASEKVRDALSAVAGSRCRALADAAHDTEVVILALPLTGVVEGMQAIGDVGRAVVVDTTNAIGNNRLPGDQTVLDLLAAVNPGATLVKAFNTVGAASYLDPRIGGRGIFLPVAGDPQGAEIVWRLAAKMGFDPLVIPGRDAVRMVENFAEMCIYLSMRVGLGGGFGFDLMER